MTVQSETDSVTGLTALVVIDPNDPAPRPPLLEGKTTVGGKPTVYVCQQMTCSAPATTWDELAPLL